MAPEIRIPKTAQTARCVQFFMFDLFPQVPQRVLYELQSDLREIHTGSETETLSLDVETLRLGVPLV